MDYIFEHPNGGFQKVQAECDAKNFKILNDWHVKSDRAGFKTDSMCRELDRAGYNSFRFAIYRKAAVGEIISEPFYSNKSPTHETAPKVFIKGLVSGDLEFVNQIYTHNLQLVK